MIYYTSPLSTIAKVVKDKDSTSIGTHFTCFTSTKVQILTPEELLRCCAYCGGLCQLLLLVCVLYSYTVSSFFPTDTCELLDAALTAVGIVNGCFWGSYGLAIADVYVYGPNFVGAAIATITTLIGFLFRKK